LSEASTWIQNHSEEIETHTTKLADLEKSLAVNEKELDSIRDALKVKTQTFTDAIESKQKSLEPWTGQINEKKAAMAITQSELDLIREKEAAGLQALEEVQDKVRQLEMGKRKKEGELAESRRELGTIERGVGDANAELKSAQGRAAKVYEVLSQGRAKADEAKASLSASQTQGQVLTSLTRLRDSGRVTGFHVLPPPIPKHSDLTVGSSRELGNHRCQVRHRDFNRVSAIG
jgi:structural maintenance of chromosome 4